MRVVYTIVGGLGFVEVDCDDCNPIVGGFVEVDCDDGTFISSSVFWLFHTLRPDEKPPKLFLQANAAHRRQSVFPVPVGLSKSAFEFCHIIARSGVS